MPRYEFVEGTSSKFWEITLEGTSFTTTYGKIGAAGQSTTKSFGDAAAAKREHDKLVAEKTKKGYVLVGGGAPAAAAPAAKDETAAAKKAGKKKAEETEEAPPAQAAAAPAAAASNAPDRAQRYELVEGTSAKFWEITLEGTSFTTTYGKLGAAGQSTTKSFGDAAAAKREHDKLVAEKTKKGYALASGGGAPGGGRGGGGGGGVHAKAGTAFRMADLEQLDETPFDNAETFMGMKVVDFGGGGEDDEGDGEGGAGLKDVARRAWRVRVGYDDGDWLAKFEQLVSDPNAGKVKALVVGMWGEGLHDGTGAEEVRDAICKAKDRLTGLRAIFINDIQAEESEISWQHFCDVAPLLQAYPQLEHLRVRGSTRGKGKLKSPSLRSLQLEGSNTKRAMVQQVASAELPNLEHLELWLGPEGDYAEEKPLEDFVPIFSGKLFPKLKYLGLRNSSHADEVAKALATSPILERLEVVDLSLGNLSGPGGEALLASPAVARLKTLDIRHHFVPAPVLKKLKALKPLSVKATSVGGDDDDGDDEEGGRYVSVTE